MQTGYRPVISFERDIHWGPLHYPMPALAGNDWPIFLAKITVYEHR